MSHSWPVETVFRRIELSVEDRRCPGCGGCMHVCDHRQRHFFSLDGPVRLVLRLVHCPDISCAGHGKTFSPLEETAYAMPYWGVAWDVFCWIGHRRFAQHWSVAVIREELLDRFAIALSDDGIEHYIRRYQVMVAAYQSDFATFQAAYAGIQTVKLAIDGLQPEKGHETLYVVRELEQKRVWFAAPLLSSSSEEVQRLFAQARRMAASLGLSVACWVSDKQEAFVQGVAAEFPGVPHRYCQNHFLRDLAKPVLEQDTRAKVAMRSRVRGLRAIERDVLAQRQEAASSASGQEFHAPDAPHQAVISPTPPISQTGDVVAAASEASRPDSEQVVLDYCAAVRGILNDNQGGPLTPPGLRMAEALHAVRVSLQSNLAAKKGGTRSSASTTRRLPGPGTGRRSGPATSSSRSLGRRAGGGCHLG